MEKNYIVTFQFTRWQTPDFKIHTYAGQQIIDFGRNTVQGHTDGHNEKSRNGQALRDFFDDIVLVCYFTITFFPFLM